MRMMAFAKRNTQELLRDPLNLTFGLGFPIVLILLLRAIQANVPVALFEIQHLTMAFQLHDLGGKGLPRLFDKVVCRSRKKSEALRGQASVRAADTSRPHLLGWAGPQQPKWLDWSLGRMCIRCLGLQQQSTSH